MTRLIFLFLLLSLKAVAQFAPPAGQIGTTAMHNDSSVFVGWATGCKIVRGYQNIADTTLGYASVGDSSMALGMAGANGVVSLGDGGEAILTFASPIQNKSGFDFAVFENAFSDTYLELGYVEVSSDGINYFRFPCTSNSQDTVQINGFGSVDATKLDNLAGKYRALYGTPFDLQQLSGISGLDINAVTHVKIIDVVGCIQNQYARHDKNGHKINELWSTPYPSSGFDLDAVGVIHQAPLGIADIASRLHLQLFPNPAKEVLSLQFSLENGNNATLKMNNVLGEEVFTKTLSAAGWQNVSINTSQFASGIYMISVITTQGIASKKIMIYNE
jgi:hypothetical protein